VLVNAEKLYQGCAEAEQVLYEDEDAAVARLGRCLGKLRELARIDPHLSEAADLLGSTEALLQETASLLRRYRERIQFEPGELDQVEARLNEIGRLMRKYRASEEELLALQQKLEGELRTMTSAEEALPLLERECAGARGAAWELAANLSRERKRVAKKLDREMKAALAELGMAESAFESRFADSSPTAGADPEGAGISESGMDQIEFYFSPNPGEVIKPLAKIASGGELSRTMLAIKSLVLGEGDISTLIFDEVDAGIGGRIAEIVGAKLKDVAVSHQVICVTHLPQIAAQAAAHYVVEKEVSKGRTYTAVRRLSEKERIGELARMLGGLKITDKTLRHAEEMLKMQGLGKGH
jgi:DNA repair protein RecN (Recombination protein N)